MVANFNTPEGRQRLNDMLDSLRVSTENLKVVSYQRQGADRDAGGKAVARFLGRRDGPAPPETKS